jgi:hypothetical protein
LRNLVGIVALSLIVIALILPVSGASASTPAVNVRRQITIGDWGAVVFNDTYTVLNNGTASVNDFVWGLPRSGAEGLRFVMAKSSADSLQIDRDIEKDPSFYWLKARFKDPLAPGKNTTINVASIHSGIIQFFQVQGTEGTEELYRVTFSAYPVLKVRAGSCNVTVYTAWDAKFQLSYNSTFVSTRIDGKPVLVSSRKPLEPLTDERYSFNFSSSSQHVVSCDLGKRQISISPQGDVSISDYYHLNNLATSFSSVRLILPKETAEVMAYDDVGPIWTTPKNTFDVSVEPRFRTVRQNESFAFRLEYKLSPGKSAKQLEWWGLYNLNLRLLEDSPWMIDKEEVRILLPRGTTIESNSVPTDGKLDTSLYETVLSYSFEPATPLHDLTLNMKYRYLPFWSALTPLMWILLAQIVIVGAIAVSKVEKPAKPVAAAPVGRILQFVESYDERTALRLELDKMEEDMARGAVSRHEYRRRSREIETRIEEIRKELQVVKTDLTAASPRYAEMIRRMERAEAELDATKASFAQLRSQYRSGKMTRQIYDSMMSDLRKRQDRARETINSAIITLREETR